MSAGHLHVRDTSLWGYQITRQFVGIVHLLVHFISTEEITSKSTHSAAVERPQEAMLLIYFVRNRAFWVMKLCLKGLV